MKSKASVDVTTSESGYVEVDSRNATYVLANVDLLHSLLRFPTKYNVREALRRFVHAYEELRSNSHEQYVKTGMFEKCIDLYTRFQGLHYDDSKMSPVKVDRMGKASTVDEIVEHIRCIRCEKKNHNAKIWLNLNVDKRRSFQGYDFAYIEVKHTVGQKHSYKVLKVQLFEVTVSISSKCTPKAKTTMALVANKIWRKLSDAEDTTCNDREDTVFPILLVPANVVGTAEPIEETSDGIDWTVNIGCFSTTKFLL